MTSNVLARFDVMFGYVESDPIWTSAVPTGRFEVPAGGMYVIVPPSKPTPTQMVVTDAVAPSHWSVGPIVVAVILLVLCAYKLIQSRRETRNTP